MISITTSSALLNHLNVCCKMFKECFFKTYAPHFKISNFVSQEFQNFSPALNGREQRKVRSFVIIPGSGTSSVFRAGSDVGAEGAAVAFAAKNSLQPSICEDKVSKTKLRLWRGNKAVIWHEEIKKEKNRFFTASPQHNEAISCRVTSLAPRIDKKLICQLFSGVKFASGENFCKKWMNNDENRLLSRLKTLRKVSWIKSCDWKCVIKK